jgi:hypothetical protein
MGVVKGRECFIANPWVVLVAAASIHFKSLCHSKGRPGAL